MKYKIYDKESIEYYFSLEFDENYEPQEENNIVKDISNSERFLQIIRMPDFKYLSNFTTDMFFIAQRKPNEVKYIEDRPRKISRILDIVGPYEISKAIDKLEMIHNTTNYPIIDEVRVLRPKEFDDIEYWISCPECKSETKIDIKLEIKSGMKRSKFSLECTDCNSSITRDDSENNEYINWLNCPICGLKNVKFACSIPYGFINFSCNKCNYNTNPSELDRGFSQIHYAGLENHTNIKNI